jgi:glycosyltransferase involved in cell wall biosynthesis
VLPDCLASLSGLVDRTEVCDTGSTDDTVAIAKSFGANVSHRAWRDDFAWARNEVLDRCQDAVYVLQIDADERVRCDDPEAVRRSLAALADSARVLAVAIDNLDSVGSGDGIRGTFGPAPVFRTSALRMVGGYARRFGDGTPVRTIVDLIVWDRLQRTGRQVARLPPVVGSTYFDPAARREAAGDGDDHVIAEHRHYTEYGALI